MRTLLTITILSLIVTQGYSQTPNWPSIKSHTVPFVSDTTEYGTPYIQAHNNLGWEDGMFISRDGLRMYAFYLPADLVSFSNYLTLNPICPPIHQHIRGPLLGVDTITNPWGCPSILHSDIIYASRNDTSLPFNNWQPSNLANPGEWEGAPQSIVNSSGSLEFFVYTMSNNAQTDIYWFRDTVDNPTGPGVIMPSPVNSPSFSEDNPHLERINDTTLVLFLDNHSAAGSSADIFYTISYDDGVSWQPKLPVSTVNSMTEDIQPHLWFDGNDWWLYYATNDTVDINNRLSIFRMKQSIPGDFDSWADKELVIGPGTVTDNSGYVAAVGEPTLTTWGDISFVVAVQALGTPDTTDVFELDPWYLPRKHPINTAILNNSYSENIISVFPNPATDNINISTSKNGKLSIYTLFGKKIVSEVNLIEGVNNIKINLPPKMYILIIENQTSIIYRKVIIK
jgi:hypothetical protein